VRQNGTHDVKQIIAIVKPFLAEKVLEALKMAPLEAFSVTEVKGYGRQKSYLDEYAETEYALAFLPKVEITLWVDDARSEEILRKIVEVARTGRMGDGKIFMLPAWASDAMPAPKKSAAKAVKPAAAKSDSKKAK
jgi:nitrogen regulatory protein P-II 1